MAQPQPILTPLTPAAIFLVVTIGEGGEQTVRDVLADLSGLERSVGFRVPASGLSACRDRLRRLGPAVRRPPPRRAAPVRPARRPPPPRPGHAGRPAVPHPRQRPGRVLRTRDRDHRPARRRRHAGRRDARVPLLRRSATCSASSTAPRTRPGRRPAVAALVGAEDPEFAGGSYVIVQKYLHDLDALERAAGRGAGAGHRPHQARPTSSCPTTSSRANSHVALNTDRRRRRHRAADRARQHAVRQRRATASSAPTSSATPRTPERHRADAASNMFIGSRRATTTASSTSPPRSPAPCSSCRRPTSSTTVPAAARQHRAATMPTAGRRCRRHRPGRDRSPARRLAAASAA